MKLSGFHVIHGRIMLEVKVMCDVCNEGTCGVRGLYGELLSRSARMLVRESISASRLERLSSRVFSGPFI